MSEKLLGKSNDSLKKSNNSMKSMVKSSIVNKSSQKFSMKKCNPSLNKVPLSSDVMAKALDEKSSRIDNSSSTNNRLLLNQIFDQTADNSNENDWIACKAINLGEQISAEQKSSIETSWTTLKSSAIDDCKSNITKSKLK